MDFGAIATRGCAQKARLEPETESMFEWLLVLLSSCSFFFSFFFLSVCLSVFLSVFLYSSMDIK